MAITPPSDIVLGVASAVDPLQYQAAVERLRSLRAGPSSSFVVPEVRPSYTEADQARPADTPKGASGLPVSGLQTQVRNRLDTFGQLEAFVLQSFIQSMLPKEAKTVFGKGTAGQIWRSMLAEKLAAELAQSGQVGLAKQLAQGRGNATAKVLDAVAPAVIPSAMGPTPSFLSLLPYLASAAGGLDAASEIDVQSPSERS